MDHAPSVRLAAGVVDLARGVLVGQSETVALTDTEAELLRYLHRHQGRAVGRDELLEQVWGYRRGVNSRTVESTIQRLRAKIERDPRAPEHLRTVRGLGYRLDPAPDPTDGAVLPEDAVLLDPIFGRESELATLLGWLRAGTRLVTVTGPPGIGKTWLVRALLGALPEAERGFVDLTGLHTPSELRGATTAPSRGVWVLDDTGQLGAEAVQELTRWLRRSSALSLVVTSHERLAVEGEQTLPLDLLSLDAAVLLLQHRLRALGLDEADPELLRRVADRIERLPLALDVIAASFEAGPQPTLDLARLLDAPPVHRGTRTLREAVLRAVERLPPQTVRDLSALALFRGTFSAEAAAAVASERGLAALRRRSLVRRLPDGRFTLYDAVRAAVPPASPDAAQRLAAWFERRATSVEAPPELAPHRADLVALITGGLLPEAHLPPLLHLLGALVVRYGTTRDWETLQAAVPRAGPAIRARLCWLVAIEHRAATRQEAADRYAALGLESDPDDALASRLWVLRAQSATNLGAPDTAAHYARLALARAEAGGLLADQLRALQALGLSRAQSDPLEAEEILSRAVALAREIGDGHVESGLLGTLAYTRLALG